MREFRPYPKPEKVLKVPKPYKYIRKATGEAELFKAIWRTRKHICEWCKVQLQDPPLVSYFSHKLSKKQHPELRLDASNIWLLCTDCHTAYDHGTKAQFEKRKVA